MTGYLLHGAQCASSENMYPVPAFLYRNHVAWIFAIAKFPEISSDVRQSPDFTNVGLLVAVGVPAGAAIEGAV